MPTDNYGYSEYSARARARAREERRRKRRRAAIIRTIVIILIIALIVVLGVFLLKRIKKDSLKDPYDVQAGYDKILQVGFSSETLELFAKDICVVTDNIVGEEVRNEDDGQGGTVRASDSGFTAGAGLLCRKDGGYSAFAKEAFTPMNPASTTKIMTCILALKYGNLEDKVTLTKDAAIDESGASLAGVEPGDVLTLEQLLYGMMLPSGNDAANAVAVHIGGSLQGFYDMMNEEARRIGAWDTHFSNANGITAEDHLTTAYDMYLITREALNYPKFREIATAKYYTAAFLNALGEATSRSWNNSNGYISGKRELIEGLSVIGGKTGTTLAAGNCLILATENEDGEEYVSVVLAAQGKDNLYKNMDFLLQKIDN